jgi:integrase
MGLSDKIKASMVEGSWIRRMFEEGTILKRQHGDENVFHDLRHTFASLMLLRGAKPKVIFETLGRASIAFTMDVYSHIIEGMQSDAMALLDEVLPMAQNSHRGKINANLTPTHSIMPSNN